MALGGHYDFSIRVGPAYDSLVYQAATIPGQMAHWGLEAARLHTEIERATDAVTRHNNECKAISERFHAEYRKWVDAMRARASNEPEPTRPVEPALPPPPVVPDIIDLRRQGMEAQSRFEAARMRALLVSGLLPHPLERVVTAPAPAKEQTGPGGIRFKETPTFALDGSPLTGAEAFEIAKGVLAAQAESSDADDEAKSVATLLVQALSLLGVEGTPPAPRLISIDETTPVVMPDLGVPECTYPVVKAALESARAASEVLLIGARNTGKTTIAAELARESIDRGERVVLVTVARDCFGATSWQRIAPGIEVRTPTELLDPASQESLEGIRLLVVDDIGLNPGPYAAALSFRSNRAAANQPLPRLVAAGTLPTDNHIAASRARELLSVGAGFVWAPSWIDVYLDGADESVRKAIIDEKINAVGTYAYEREFVGVFHESARDAEKEPCGNA
jgi:hypothetical protein